MTICRAGDFARRANLPQSTLLIYDPNQRHIPHCPASQRGGSRSSRTRGGMRWTQRRRADERRRSGRRSRVVLTPRRWRQVRGRQLSRATVARKPGHRGERGISRKTIARGMPGVSGVTVVTNACAFYTPHAAAGASSARHSLRPLFEGHCLAKLGRISVARLRKRVRATSLRGANGSRERAR
jgi:hypothetical protein